MNIGWKELEILGDRTAHGEVLECIWKGVFCALLGPPRSGKTFTLRLVKEALDSDERTLSAYINLDRYEFFSSEINPGRALNDFFFQLARTITSQVHVEVSNLEAEQGMGGDGFVRTVEAIARSGLYRIVLLFDHFEVLPSRWGYALLAALRSVYDRRLQSDPHFKRITVVLGSSVDIFEPSLGKTSPLSIARMVRTNDLTRQQVETFLRTNLARQGLTVPNKDLNAFYEATRGNRILTLTLCNQWIRKVRQSGELVPYAMVQELYLSRMKQDHRIGLMISQIEENVECLIQILDLLRNTPVKRRSFQTSISDVELTGAVRISNGEFAIHNPVFEAALRRHFTPERVIYLLDKADHPLIVLRYLEDVFGAGIPESYQELYLKVLSDVYAWIDDDLTADKHLLQGMSRIFEIERAQIYHISEQQVLVSPRRKESSPHDEQLARYAIAQRAMVPSDTDPVTVAIPIDAPSGIYGDVLLLPRYCDRDRFVRERGRLTVTRRFAREAIQNRVRQARAKQSHRLQELSVTISARLEEERLLEEIVQSARRIISADFATIHLYDASVGSFERGASAGVRNPQATHQPPRKNGVFFGMMQRGQPVTVTASQLTGDAKVFGTSVSSTTIKFFEEEDVQVVRAYPILAGERRIGVLTVGYRRPHFFRPLEDESIRALLSQAALIISRGHLLGAIRRITRAVGVRADASSEDQVQTLLYNTTRQVCRVLGLSKSYAWQVRLLEGQRATLSHGVTHKGRGGGEAPSFPFGLLSEEEVEPGEPIVLSTTHSPEAYSFLQQMGLGKSVSGIIGFASSPRRRVSVLVVGIDLNPQRAFTPWDLSMARVLLAQVAAQAESVYLFDKSEERLERLKAIFRISERCSRFEDETELLQEVIQFAVETMPEAEAGSIHLLDRSGNYLDIVAQWGYGEEKLETLRRIRLKKGDGYAGRAVQDQSNLNIGDFDGEMEQAGLGNPLHIKSALIIPIVVKKRALGTINVDNLTSKAAFGDAEEKWLETLANQVAIAVDRLQLIDRLEKELRVLGEVINRSPEAVSTLDLVLESLMSLPKHLFQSILDQAAELTKAEIGNIRLYDQKKDVLVNCACFPNGADIGDRATELPSTQGIVGKSFVEGRSILAANPEQLRDQGFLLHSRKDIRSELAVPLRVRSGSIGVINLESTQENAFTERDLEALERFAAVMASKIEQIIVLQRATEKAEQTIQRRSRRGLFHLGVDRDLRVSFELRPTSVVSETGTDPIPFDVMGMTDAEDLRHELGRLRDYIQMAYQLGAEDRRSEWLRWAKRIGVRFTRAIESKNLRLASTIWQAQMAGMDFEEILFRIRTPRENLGLPFELLYLGDDPLIIRYPLVRTVERASCTVLDSFEAFISRRIEKEKPIHVLLIGADAAEGMSASQEIKDVKWVLLQAQDALGIPFKITMCCDDKGTYHHVQACLKNARYHIIHIATEGVFNEDEPDESAILLPMQPQGHSCKPLRVLELGPLLAQARPRFVYLSLCRGAQMASDFTLRAGSTLGIMDTLVRRGIPAVLGYRWDVTDEGAREFAAHFYRHLFARRSLELATFQARLEVYQQNSRSETWLSPVLVNQMVDEQFWTAEL